jgi:hypothetical protein
VTEIAVILVVSAIFWFLSRRIGSRVWLMLGAYWLMCFIAWSMDKLMIGMIVALIPTIILRLVFSIRADKDRTRAILNERAKDPRYRGAILCPKCGVVVFPDMSRCKECGASLAQTTRLQRGG